MLQLLKSRRNVCITDTQNLNNKPDKRLTKINYPNLTDMESSHFTILQSDNQVS